MMARPTHLHLLLSMLFAQFVSIESLSDAQVSWAQMAALLLTSSAPVSLLNLD